MPPDEAQISVVITTYNSERFVAEAIDSVLAQTLPPFEIVVADDGSTDQTAAVVGAYGARVRWLPHTHGGVGAIRNFGIAHTTGRLLALLDGDDVWLPDKLEKQVAVLASDERPDAVFGHVLQWLSPDLDPETAARLFAPAEPLAGRMASTLLIRREAYQAAGDFRTDLAVTEFIHWYGMLVDSGARIAVLPEVVTRRRIHGANNSMRQQAMMIEYPRVLKAALDRRRAQGQ